VARPPQSGRLSPRPRSPSATATALTEAPRRPEIRIEQLTGLRAILAPGRAERPDAFTPAEPAASPDAAERCPFCEGREDRTPPEVWAERPGGGEPDTPGWSQRAVPNLYPALEPGAPEPASAVPAGSESGLSSAADPLRSSSRNAEPELFRAAAAAGAHEVVVHTPEHRTRLGELSEAELAGALGAWRQRLAAHSGEASYVHLIVNEGPLAGASLEHSHAQLYALPFVPAEVARERERFTAYHERTLGGHLLQDVLTEEVRRRDRLVAVDSEAVLFCPWASRAPFELRLLPRTPAARFEEDDRGAALLARALEAFAAAFGTSPQLNLWVRTAPRGTDEFHWHIDILPRLTIRAGFELGTGVEVNVYPPERAAADLREALGD
jgi:UDPglucose--hexose-1-phosphate uridylyltransferase